MRIKSLLVSASALALLSTGVAAQPPAQGQGQGRGGGAGAAPVQTIDARTTGFQKLDGYMPLYWDEKTGSLWMEINKFDTEMLYSTGLTAGLGSNDIGLDRGQGGQGRVVKFQRIGPRVMMVQPNYTFRANSTNPDERRAVEDAFAKSILWGFAVGAETDGRVLVDATDFFLRDAHNVIPRLRPGNFRVDRTRSAIDLPWTKGFPKNTEVDAILTFANDGAAGGGRGGGGGPAQGPPPVGSPMRRRRLRRRHVLRHGRQRHADGRRGHAARASHLCRAARRQLQAALRRSARGLRRPAGTSTTRRRSARRWCSATSAGIGWRRSILRRASATRRSRSSTTSIAARRSRSAAALLEGARWWNQAFTAAGYRNAFRVELLPEGADPMDIRYNMINWVHRSTRGWSSGATDLRSADRRDHQGDGHARLAARSPGLPDRRGPARALQDRHRDARRSWRRRRSRASASSRRTRSATRSVSATSTTTARRGGSR